MQPLEQTQREFFSALRLPLRGTSRRSTELPPSEEPHSDEFLATAGKLLKSGSNLSSAERLELYHRQYWFRLLDSIAEDFPQLRKMAGEETFWQLMEAYLESCPSDSYTLRHLGRRVADFTAEWERLSETERLWFSALARLEYAYMEIYEAAEWPAAAPDDLATAVLGLQPHVRLLDLPAAADLCEGWEKFEPTPPERTFLVVWRMADGAAARRRLDPVEFVLLDRLRDRGKLASLFEKPTDREPAPEEISAWFADWQRNGWIALPPDDPAADFPVVPRHDVRQTDWSRLDKMGSQARAMED